MKTEVIYKTSKDDLEKCSSLVIENGLVKCKFGNHCSAHVPIAHVSESFFNNKLVPLTEKEIRAIAMSG